MKQQFFEGDYICKIGTTKVEMITEVEHFFELDEYVYYTDKGNSYGISQIEPMEIVFQREYEKSLKEKEMTAEAQVEEILHEASAYGLRQEVMDWARKYMDEGYDRVHAYELAYNEWVK